MLFMQWILMFVFWCCSTILQGVVLCSAHDSLPFFLLLTTSPHFRRSNRRRYIWIYLLINVIIKNFIFWSKEKRENKFNLKVKTLIFSWIIFWFMRNILLSEWLSFVMMINDWVLNLTDLFSDLLNGNAASITLGLHS